MDSSLPWICPWDSIGKNTGVGCHFLLQGIFPNQELNPGLLHCRQILYQLSYEGSPILPCVISALTGVREHSEVWLWLSLGPGLRGLHCNTCYKTISLFSFLSQILSSFWDLSKHMRPSVAQKKSTSEPVCLNSLHYQVSVTMTQLALKQSQTWLPPQSQLVSWSSLDKDRRKMIKKEKDVWLLYCLSSSLSHNLWSQKRSWFSLDCSSILPFSCHCRCCSLVAKSGSTLLQLPWSCLNIIGKDRSFLHGRSNHRA